MLEKNDIITTVVYSKDSEIDLDECINQELFILEEEDEEKLGYQIDNLTGDQADNVFGSLYVVGYADVLIEGFSYLENDVKLYNGVIV